MPLASESITANYRSILARIAAARKGAIAPAPETRLVAISKTHDAATIRPVLEAGHRLFGENKVQEAEAKWLGLKAEFPGVELHMTGSLQTNKVKEAVALFDVIETLDRPKLARALKAEGDRTGRIPRVFVQVNIGEEPQKGGVVPRDALALVAECQSLGLPVDGLMCVPPFDQAPAPHFALLQKLGREAGLPFLSMGMSDDFEIAIRYGATHVRVGTAIFGERDYAGS
jgi:PLP dependent protein